MNVYISGIRTGETIIGIGTQNLGSVLQIRGFYPPYREAEVEATTLRDVLNNYEFFSPLSYQERLAYLQENGTSVADLYLNEIEGLEVKVYKLEKDFRKFLTDDQIDMFIRGNPDDPDGYWPLKTLYDTIPRKPGSKARFHTLIFRPWIWSLQPMDLQLETYSGTIIKNRTMYPGVYHRQLGEKLMLFHTDTIEYCIVYPKSGSKLNYERFNRLAGVVGVDLSVMESFIELIRPMSPGLLKSLLQKIIRTCATYISHEDILYPAREALIGTFIILYLHPPSFVPNLNRSVSGAESATKRLAVTIMEDSTIDNITTLTSLLLAAYYYQTSDYDNWSPSDEEIIEWMYAALEALDSKYVYDYRFSTDEKTEKDLNTILIRGIGAFEGDKAMFETFNLKGRLRLPYAYRTWSGIMPLIHCIDHHTYTELVYYMPVNLITPTFTYGDFYLSVWDQLISFNPRRKDSITIDTLSEYQQHLRDAQLSIWLSKTQTHQNLPVSDDTIDMDYELKDEWLAAFIGMIEIKVKQKPYYAILHPQNLKDVEVMRKPSRENLGEIPKDVIVDVVAKFYDVVTLGVIIKSPPSFLSMFKGKKITYHMGSYYVEGVTWNVAKKLNLTFPIHTVKFTEPFVIFSLLYTGTGIHQDAFDILNQKLVSFSDNVLRRLQLFINTNSKYIEMYHLSRDGTGTTYAVAYEDVVVYDFLSTLAAVIPGALLKTGIKFEIKNGPLFWFIRDKIKDYITEKLNITVSSNWMLSAMVERPLTDYQRASVQNLIDSPNDRMKLIRILPGLGKTAIVAHYIRFLIEANKMPPYCMYILPKSALVNVQSEFKIAGVPTVELNMNKSNGGSKSLRPGIVNFVSTHHLIKSDLATIKNQISSTLLIIDELHTVYSEVAKKTSSALELAQLAWKTIGMTGTPIKSDDLSELLTWLRLTVEFDVTENNYMIAFASSISYSVEIDIDVKRVEIDVPMTPIENRQYKQLVPAKLGGIAPKIRFTEAVALSWTVVERGMIELITTCVDAGKGCFVVAKNEAQQLRLKTALTNYDVYLINTKNPIDLKPDSPYIPQVTITTPTHSEGYNMTAYGILIQGVPFSNEATREQLECRIIRKSQLINPVVIYTVHAGILSLVFDRYKRVRNISKSINELSKTIGENLTIVDF